jgi:hypothetical protein
MTAEGRSAEAGSAEGRGAERSSPSSRPRLPWGILVGIAAFVVYLPALGNGFTLDDITAVEEDARLRSVDGAIDLVLEPYLWNKPPARSPYRPVTTLSYVLSWHLGGGTPFAFHLFNLLAHVAATLLVLAVLVRLGASHAAAGIAALLFAVHPVHVEAVANVVGRADVLMTVFCLLGAWIYLASQIPGWARIGGVSLAYLFAIGAKENGYVFPLLILLIEVLRPVDETAALESWKERLSRILRAWRVHAAMALTLVLYLLVRRSVLASVVQLDIAAYMAILPATLRTTTAVANLTEVVRLLVFPNDLSWHYGPAVLNPAGPGDMRFWGGVATCVLVAALAVKSLGQGAAGRWALCGIGWIAISFALLSNLIVPMPMWLAERTLYLPTVGVAFLTVAGIELLRRRGITPSHRGVVAVVGLLVLLGSARSWQYSQVWQSNETLVADLIERHPESFHAPWWTGQRLVDAGQLERGLVWLERAVESNPNEAMVRLDYARALLLVERGAEAEAQLRPIPRGLHPSVSVLLAQSLIFQERMDEAREVIASGLLLFPDEERLQAQMSQVEGRDQD